jgi:hypothetical protein
MAEMKHRKGSTGVVVKVTLWSLAEYTDSFDSESARLWIKGTIDGQDMEHARHFNDAGELITILGELNRKKLKELKKAKKEAAKGD